ncbi:MAG: beta-propeller fold lactonase family protein [Candidatus Acidiferrales bacterium]
MLKFKKFVHILPLLSLLGLSGCIGSGVKSLFITGVKLTPANPTIGVTGTQQFVLTATYVGGQTSNVTTSDATYSSDNTAVATINALGFATAVSIGTANILASYKGNNTKTLLTVAATVLGGSAVQGDSRVLHVTNLRTGQRMTFAANGLGDSLTVSRDGEGVAATEVSVLPEHGPGWLAIDPSGSYLYVVNQTSGSVSAFSVNWKTAELNPIVGSPFAAPTKPSSVEVNPDGTGISVAHFEDSTVSHYRIDPATGALTPEP